MVDKICIEVAAKIKIKIKNNLVVLRILCPILKTILILLNYANQIFLQMDGIPVQTGEAAFAESLT